MILRETNRTTAFLESRKKEKCTTSSHTQSHILPPPRPSNEDIPLWNRKYTKPIPSPLYRWSAIAKRSRIDTASSRPSGTRTKKKKSRALEQRREEKAKRGVFDSTRPLGHTAHSIHVSPIPGARPGCGFAIEERWIHADRNLVPTISYSFREGCVIRHSSPSNRYSIPFSISKTGAIVQLAASNRARKNDRSRGYILWIGGRRLRDPENEIQSCYEESRD